MRSPPNIVSACYRAVVHRTILRYSEARSGRSPSDVHSDFKRPKVSVRPNTLVPAPKAAPAPAAPVLFMVNGHYGLRRLSLHGAWVIHERFEERLGCGRQVERYFVRGVPGSLEMALEWLAGHGVDRAALLQLRHRLTPEAQRLRLIP